MSTTFIISDTHFGHKNILHFKKADGSPLRPFSSVEEMDETMVENWNKVVSPEDKVYHLGDVLFTKQSLQLLSRLNGTKILIKGNHDNMKLKDYVPYFKDIRGSHKLDSCILSHIPVHPCQFDRWGRGGSFSHNLHGHLHSNRVMLDGEIDPRYISMCVEQINFTPKSWDVIRKEIEEYNNGK